MSFLEQFKDATIGFSGYPRLARNKTGGFGYMVLLLAIVLTISAVINTVNIRREAAFMAQQLAGAPDFGLRDGEVYFDGPMPYRVEEDGLVMIVDTTGQTGPEVLENAAPNSMLITRTLLYRKLGPARIESFDLSEYPVDVTRQDLMRLLERMWMFVPLVYLFIYLFQMAFKALDAVILALIAQLYGSMVRRPVPFSLGFRLGLYAMTLSVVIQWVFQGFTTLRPLGFAIWWGLAVLYLIMGLRAYFQEESGYPAYHDE